jgi:type I restriction enzyme S subunit
MNCLGNAAMNADFLLNHFDRIAEAPDAIPRLRRFILDLAVRGKLVEQDPSDEPAGELLKRIQEEKEKLVKKCVLKKTSPHRLKKDLELQVKLPSTWEWVCLGDIAQYGVPEKVNSNKEIPEDTWVLDLEDIEKDSSRLISRVMSSDRYFQSTKTIFKKGDILFGKLRPYLNKVLVADSNGVCTTEIIPIRSYFGILPEYSKLVLKSPLTMQRVDRLMYGMKMPRLGTDDAISLSFPLPPLAEQHRIVTKVDELMALCDQLETAKNERETRRDQLVASSLNRVSEAQDPITQSAVIRFHLDHLPCLTTRPEHIKQLRQTILNLAVRGRLVEQDPNDEPVTTQLAISDRTRKEIAKQDRRADTDLQPLLAAEDRWEIPTSWSWLALADLVLFIDYRGQTPSKVDQGVRLITAKNIKKGFINLFPEEFLSETNYHTWMTRGSPKEGDVLFTTEAPMGNAAVVRLSERFALAQRVICFRSYGGINTDFLVLQLVAEPFQLILDKTATGLTAKGIKAAKLKRLPVAIPPLAEQHRIVAKVDELMALCDQLEAQLTTTQTDNRRLLEAILHPGQSH